MRSIVEKYENNPVPYDGVECFKNLKITIGKSDIEYFGDLCYNTYSKGIKCKGIEDCEGSTSCLLEINWEKSSIDLSKNYGIGVNSSILAEDAYGFCLPFSDSPHVLVFSGKAYLEFPLPIDY
jgi:hypothetical protein